MGSVEVVWRTGARDCRVLGAVWVCESGVDRGRAGELESAECVELRACGTGVYAQCVLPGQESVSCDKRDG